MERLVLLKATVDDPEVAILRISDRNEHAALHKAGTGLDLVNSNHIFSVPARALEFKTDPAPPGITPCAAAENTSWMVMMAHMPSCTALASCMAVSNS